jgi:Cu+-exporting ATPase
MKQTLRPVHAHPGPGGMHAHDHAHSSVAGHSAAHSDGQEIDPVCGMVVKPTSPHRTHYQGRDYGFCSAGCLKKFVADPAAYLTPKPASAAVPAPVVQPGVKYTCPMHPEIVQDGPGSCPICGMALESMTISQVEPENVELKDMTRRFVAGAVLAAPLFVIAMLHVMSPWALWLQFFLASPVVLWAGAPFFQRGWE